MKTISVLLVYVVGIATYAAPFVLGFVWLVRVWRFDDLKHKRVIAGWASLVLASVATGMFWFWALNHPMPATAEFDLYFVKCAKASMSVAVLALLTALFGKGRFQWLVVVESALTPFSWVLAKMLE
jgi:hypothetical protein